jgi:hypothetical protein
LRVLRDLARNTDPWAPCPSLVSSSHPLRIRGYRGRSHDGGWFDLGGPNPEVLNHPRSNPGKPATDIGKKGMKGSMSPYSILKIEGRPRLVVAAAVEYGVFPEERISLQY